MSDPALIHGAIIEAAARAIAKFTEMPDYWDENDSRLLALVMLAAVTPLIRAAVLEEAAMVADALHDGFTGDNDYYAGHRLGALAVAARIRALKEQP